MGPPSVDGKSSLGDQTPPVSMAIRAWGIRRPQCRRNTGLPSRRPVELGRSVEPGGSDAPSVDAPLPAARDGQGKSSRDVCVPDALLDEGSLLATRHSLLATAFLIVTRVD